MFWLAPSYSELLQLHCVEWCVAKRLMILSLFFYVYKIQ